MDKASGVGVVEGIAHLGGHAGDLLQWQRVLVDSVRERTGLDEGHHDKREPVRLAVVVDRQNVGVLEAGENRRFLFEASQEFAVLDEMTRENLQRDVSVDGGLIVFVDGGHAAGPQGDTMGYGPREVFHASCPWTATPSLSGRPIRSMGAKPNYNHRT